MPLSATGPGASQPKHCSRANRYQQQFVPANNFQSSTVSVSPGSVKQVDAKSVWATNTQLPQVVTLTWYFAPDVSSTMPTTRIGFGRAGGLMTYDKGTASTPVTGRVDAENATLTSPSDGRTLAQHQNAVYSSSGTNIDDTMDVPLYYGSNRSASSPFAWVTNPTEISRHYYTLQFVRAVAE